MVAGDLSRHSLQTSGPPSAPPESWVLARKVALRVVKPLSQFMHIEAASGILLLASAAVALVWANSPWAESYEHFWHTPIAISVGHFSFEKSLHFWINDGLMVLFFFVVGLEIRREMHEGELSDVKRAALPAIAAIGGMLAPAGIYLIFASRSSVAGGWGVPMATDIAFAVGVLTLLGKRVPAALRVLLLALAIIDDIGAILVIAVFLSQGVQLAGLGVAALGVLVILGMQRLGIRRAFAYVAPALVVWAGMLQAGVHPTIAGVIVGLLTPVRSWFGKRGFLSVAKRAVRDLSNRERDVDQQALAGALQRLNDAQREALPPVVRLTTLLHGWVAFGIMPLFALANAGVNIGAVRFSGAEASVIGLGVVLGLFVGKPLGIFAACWLSVKAGICNLPRGVDWRGVTVVGMVGGIGFTMAIFVAGLALPDAQNLGVAKLSVLTASALAGLTAMVVGRFLLPSAQAKDVADLTVDDVEASTEY